MLEDTPCYDEPHNYGTKRPASTLPYGLSLIHIWAKQALITPAVKDFALTKGLLVALLAGVMSACFALGLDAGTPIKEAALAGGVAPLYAGLPVIFLVTLGAVSYTHLCEIEDRMW